MKQKYLKFRLVGAEDSTIFEGDHVPVDTIVGLISTLKPDEVYLEVSVCEENVSVPIGTSV